MKTKFALFFFILSCTKLTAQDMSVEFSIEWKEKLDFQFEDNEGEDIHPAFLNITYRNLSDKPLYCLRVADGIRASDLPNIFFMGIPSLNWKTSKKLRFPIRYNTRFDTIRSISNYIVGFESFLHLNLPLILTWNVREDTTALSYKMYKKPLYEKEFKIYEDMVKAGKYYHQTGPRITSVDQIGDGTFSVLTYVYDNIYYYYYATEEDEEKRKWKPISEHPDITEQTIMNNYKDKFVFLKPGETFVQTFNLIGFQLLEGTYTFQLDDIKSHDFIEIPVYKQNSLTIDYFSKPQLPLQVGEYELFNGIFLTNQVRVKFPRLIIKDF